MTGTSGWTRRHPDVFDSTLAFVPLAEPPFFEYPYSRVDGALVRDDRVWALWSVGVSETTGTQADPAKWRALDAIGIDGASDSAPEWFVNECAHMSDQLASLGVEHDFWPSDGRAGNHIPAHVVSNVLLFFEGNLVRP